VHEGESVMTTVNQFMDMGIVCFDRNDVVAGYKVNWLTCELEDGESITFHGVLELIKDGKVESVSHYQPSRHSFWRLKVTTKD
jgi:hypothetical protein